MWLTDLGPAFTLEDAREAGLRKEQVYALLAQGEIERVGRGVYVGPDVLEPAFVSIAAATAIRGDAALPNDAPSQIALQLSQKRLSLVSGYEIAQRAAAVHAMKLDIDSCQCVPALIGRPKSRTKTGGVHRIRVFGVFGRSENFP